MLWEPEEHDTQVNLSGTGLRTDLAGELRCGWSNEQESDFT